MGINEALGLLTRGQVLSCSVNCRVTGQQWSEILLPPRKRQTTHESRGAL
jgi:hypothetical protein